MTDSTSHETRKPRIKQRLSFLEKIKNLKQEKATVEEAITLNMPVLTPEELKNGWSPESLKNYLQGREKAQNGVLMFDPEYRSRVRPRWANNSYSPLRWRI